LDRLYDVIERSAQSQPAHANAINLLVWTGARRNEVLKATWGEFDLEAGRWKRAAERNKQNKATVTPLSSLALNLLREMKGTAGAEERLFPTFRGGDVLRRYWRRVAREAGLPSLRVHDLRHVFATVMLEGGAPMDSIAKLLGHSDIVMTRIYADRSADNLKRIADRASANLAPRKLSVVTKQKAA
jgi:integrase